MDIEQLKLILQTVEAATGGAKDVAVYWLALEAGKVLLSFATTIVIAVGLYKLARTLITRLIDDHVIDKTMVIMRNEALPLQAYGSVGLSEAKEVLRVFRKGLLS